MTPLPSSHSGIGRRQLLHTVLSGAMLGAVSRAGVDLAAPRTLHAQTGLSPDEALNELLAGNQRFAANQLTSITHNLIIMKERTVNKQEPFAAVLACADSRIPVELIFDQTIGHIFVTRVAGNVVTPEIVASLEFGVAVLGIKTLLVMGHSNCGAVRAAMTTDTVPGQISVLYQRIYPAIEKSGGNIDKAVQANARIQAELPRASSTVIRESTKAGRLRVESAMYDLATGKVGLI
ncbi:MAG: carbonic anhydrase [Nitrospira sp.]